MTLCVPIIMVATLMDGDVETHLFFIISSGSAQCRFRFPLYSCT